MPSPLGHSLAGLAIAWFAQPDTARLPANSGALPAGSSATRHALVSATRTLWFSSAAIAALPDIDLLIPHTHRWATHSITATLLIFIVAIVVTGKVTRRSAWIVASTLAAAHASHLLIDWLGTDRLPPFGLQALWPFDDRFFISGVDLFPPVERRLLRPDAFGVNARAAVVEIATMGSLALLAWWTARLRCRRITVTAADKEAGE